MPPFAYARPRNECLGDAAPQGGVAKPGWRAGEGRPELAGLTGEKLLRLKINRKNLSLAAIFHKGAFEKFFHPYLALFFARV